MLKTRMLALATAALLAGCSEAPETSTDAAAAAPAAAEPPAASGFTDAEVASAIGTLSVDRYATYVETLASDEFGGRAPFSKGEELTLDYLESRFRELGIGPGNGESYQQPVSLVALTATPDGSMTVSAPDGDYELAYGDQVVTWTKRVVENVALEDSELVFVGYGIVAPEYGWDDYAGIDMAGKTAVILVNDPGFATRDDAVFNGRAMTYYGRWTYKFEEAARQGAAGALVIHETDAAGYPWEVVSGSWTGPQFDVASENDRADRVAIEGWVTQAVAERFFEGREENLAAISERAAQPGFEPVPLGIGVSTALSNTIKRSESANVLARIPGSERPDEHFVFMAHWDHLGSVFSGEDRVFNGAVDNATGTAALLELAHAFSALPRAPKRSILFLAVTAEESGLLGSAYYAENPVYPTNQTVAGINMDAMNVIGPTNDIVVVGYGSSELEDLLAEAAEAQGRSLVPEPTPEKGYFYRSDHFSFAKQGVPVLFAEGGDDIRDQEPGFGAEAARDYVANRYHKPGDEFDSSWDLTGTVEDMELYFKVALAVADGDDWPEWYEGNEFKAARDADLAP
ncbi:MAG: M28 family metallopeptidase [Pseudomonadota bacterium]